MKTFIFRFFILVIVSILLVNCSSDDSGSHCPDGYMGPYCETKITPSKVLIEKIVIRSFPLFTSDFEFWDNREDTSNEYPDLFLMLRSSTELLIVSDYFMDANENTGDIVITPLQPIEITNVLGQYTIGIFDYDGGDNYQEMAYDNFKVYKSTDVGFPDYINIYKPSQYFTADIYLSYQW